MDGKFKFEIRKMTKTAMVALVLLMLVNLTANAQPVTFQENISLPEETVINNVRNYASGILDVIAANDLYFAYTGDKVIVFDGDGQTIIEILQFPEQYGKFNSISHNCRLHMPGVNVMTIFENPLASNRQDLFIITPNLDIMLLNTDPNALTWTLVKSIPNDPDLSKFQPLHGVCRLKYDNTHQRLFWLIKGRQENEPSPYANNCTGQFHYRAVYFVIYDVDNSGNLTEFYEFYDRTISDDIPHYKDINICDFEYTRSNTGGNNDYFFLAKYNKIERWKFGDNPQTTGTVEDLYQIQPDIVVPDNIYGNIVGTDEPAYYKFGRMLFIEELNKAVAFPYRYPGNSLIDPANNPPLIYVIDGGDPINNVATIEAPNQRIYDALYVPSTNHLVISYSDHPDDKIQTSDNPTDIAWSQYSSQFASFTTLSTNPNSPAIPGIDVNSSTHLTNVNGNILISKKDEVRTLDYDGSFSSNGPPLLSAKNNFFGKGVSIGNNGIIVNKVGGKIEKFMSNGVNANYVSGVNTFFPVYHSVANTLGSKVCFFNKLNYKNSCFYIYEPDETPPELTRINNFNSPVGDCIFNPFNEEFLVSQNENFGANTPAAIVRYNSNNAIQGQINLPNTNGGIYLQNATKMFIDPCGTLYVLANSSVDVGENSMNSYPYIVSYDAATYELTGLFELDNFTVADIVNTSEYYMAHFCHSKLNNTTYFTVTPQEITLPPYHAEYNSMTGSIFPNKGYLYSIKNNTLTIENLGATFLSPGKVLCPNDGNDDYLSLNEGKLFIVSNNLLFTHTINTKETITSNTKVNDIVYSPYHDRIFAFADENNECNDDRIAVVYQNTAGSSTLQLIQYASYNGQVASFFLNQFNNKLYLHAKFDSAKLGGSPAKLIELMIEPGSSIASKTIIDLWDYTYTQNRGFYPELDHCPDFHNFAYNLTTPTIDPYRNVMYLPNGGFSNVSLVDFTPEETLILNGTSPHKGITWLSIPRHNRPANNVTPIQTVFHTNKISGTLEEITIDYNKIDDIPYAGGENIISSVWLQNAQPQWTIDPNNSHVYSTRGYIVSHFPDEQKTLSMEGAVELPDESINLYCKKDNWIGYFLYEEQNAFDALADVLDELYHIKGQTFNCYRYNYPISNDCGLKSEKDYSPGTWICNNRPNIKYGDMIMVKPEEDAFFQWNYSGNPPSNLDIPAVEHFEYEEQATYTTLVIELDTTTANPIEIGAFVNDTCVGACTVNELDSVVVLSAYMYGEPGDSVTFEQHFSSGKSTNTKVNEYLVLNNQTNIKEKRVVKTGGKQDIYQISFRNEDFEEDLTHIDDFNIHIYPNPASTIIHIEYTLPKYSSVNIVVFDAIGKKVANVFNKKQATGVNSVSWDMTGTGNQRLNKGIYFIEITIADQRLVKKVVVI